MPPAQAASAGAQVRSQPDAGAARQARSDPARGRRRHAHNTPSLGLSTGTAAQLSQSELDALRARLAQLWNPPAGARNPDELVVVILVKFKPDGTLAAQPKVVSSGSSPAVRRRPRERRARALSRPALRHAQARTLRAMERDRDQVRSARHDPRMTAAGADDRPMTRFFDRKCVEPSPTDPAGRGSGDGSVRRRSDAPGRGRAQARRHPGQCPAGADRAAGLSRRRTARSRHRPQRHPDHRVEPAALGLVRADRSGRLSRENLELRRQSALCRLAADQRPGAGHRSRHPIGGSSERRVPAVGRVRRSAARRPEILHHARQLAADRAHHLGCHLRADHRRQGLFRYPRRVRR